MLIQTQWWSCSQNKYLKLHSMLGRNHCKFDTLNNMLLQEEKTYLPFSAHTFCKPCSGVFEEAYKCSTCHNILIAFLAGNVLRKSISILLENLTSHANGITFLYVLDTVEIKKRAEDLYSFMAPSYVYRSFEDSNCSLPHWLKYYYTKLSMLIKRVRSDGPRKKLFPYMYFT